MRVWRASRASCRSRTPSGRKSAMRAVPWTLRCSKCRCSGATFGSTSPAAPRLCGGRSRSLRKCGSCLWTRRARSCCRWLMHYVRAMSMALSTGTSNWRTSLLRTTGSCCYATLACPRSCLRPTLPAAAAPPSPSAAPPLTALCPRPACREAALAAAAAHRTPAQAARRVSRRAAHAGRCRPAGCAALTRAPLPTGGRWVWSHTRCSAVARGRSSLPGWPRSEWTGGRCSSPSVLRSRRASCSRGRHDAWCLRPHRRCCAACCTATLRRGGGWTRCWHVSSSPTMTFGTSATRTRSLQGTWRRCVRVARRSSPSRRPCGRRRRPPPPVDGRRGARRRRRSTAGTRALILPRALSQRPTRRACASTTARGAHRWKLPCSCLTAPRSRPRRTPLRRRLLPWQSATRGPRLLAAAPHSLRAPSARPSSQLRRLSRRRRARRQTC
mmetsp:Transcript_14510/g.42307  ORF Transcript_14510/g.42307 Transcript_14510/m.42307 type:complete len:441 (+) Transcript_14510:494-1816(+)